MLDLCRQQASIQEAFEEVVQRVVSEARYLTDEAVTPFEESLASYCFRKYALGVGSGTAALHLALLAAGVGPGHEVITPPNSFFATAEAILQTGARPRFIDVDSGTHLITAAEVRAAVSERTRAIVPVHLFGSVVDVPAIEIALREIGRSDVIIIEDCAHAAGAWRAGRSVPLGQIAFSFNPGKNIGALGDAGAVVTDDAGIAVAVRLLRDHGRQGKNDHVLIGFNSRLDRLNDQILHLKMKYLDQWNARRRAHAARYDSAFSGHPEITPLLVEPEVLSARHQYVIRCSQRDVLREHLRASGIVTAIHYPRLIVEHEPIRRLGFVSSEVPVAERLNTQLVSLPCFPELHTAEVDYVIARVLEFSRDRTVNEAR